MNSLLLRGTRRGPASCARVGQFDSASRYSVLATTAGLILAAAILRLRNPDAWRDTVQLSRDLNRELERHERHERHRRAAAHRAAR